MSYTRTMTIQEFLKNLMNESKMIYSTVYEDPNKVIPITDYILSMRSAVDAQLDLINKLYDAVCDKDFSKIDAVASTAEDVAKNASDGYANVFSDIKMLADIAKAELSTSDTEKEINIPVMEDNSMKETSMEEDTESENVDMDALPVAASFDSKAAMIEDRATDPNLNLTRGTEDNPLDLPTEIKNFMMGLGMNEDMATMYRDQMMSTLTEIENQSSKDGRSVGYVSKTKLSGAMQELFDHLSSKLGVLKEKDDKYYLTDYYFDLMNR